MSGLVSCSILLDQCPCAGEFSPDVLDFLAQVYTRSYVHFTCHCLHNWSGDNPGHVERNMARLLAETRPDAFANAAARNRFLSKSACDLSLWSERTIGNTLRCYSALQAISYNPELLIQTIAQTGGCDCDCFVHADRIRAGAVLGPILARKATADMLIGLASLNWPYLVTRLVLDYAVDFCAALPEYQRDRIAIRIKRAGIEARNE